MSISKEHLEILELSYRVMDGSAILPKHDFGKGFSERAIEVPWAAKHLVECEEILDIGFAFASPDYMGMLLKLIEKYGKKITGSDIIDPSNIKKRYPKKWLRKILAVPIVIGDVIQMKFEENYDAVSCISTIEHIGFDEKSETIENSSFERNVNKEKVNLNRHPDTNYRVLNSLHKALKPNGKLLISVPMGKGGGVLLKDSLNLYCSQWEYEEKSWKEITTNNLFDLKEENFYINTINGWNEVSTPNDLKMVSNELKPHAEGCAMCILVKK
jgi:SAM-dependent methyltransferase